MLEAAEVETCLAEGLTDSPVMTNSPVMPLADSLGVLGVIDEARRQVGVRSPDEED